MTMTPDLAAVRQRRERSTAAARSCVDRNQLRRGRCCKCGVTVWLAPWDCDGPLCEPHDAELKQMVREEP